MVSSGRYTDYDPFAWIYNRHWGNVFTATATEVIEEALLPRISTSARILDLCCGTGQMAGILSGRGYNVTGIDGSANMLRLARRNAPGCRFELADARSFATRAKFDAVTCMFDSLNHIMSIEGLSSVFKSVHLAMTEAGQFLFDVSTKSSFLTHRDGVYGMVEDDHVCVQQTVYDSETEVARYEFTVFRLEHGEWRRSNFILRQRSYATAQVEAAVRDAGFDEVAVYGYDSGHGLEGLSSDSKRAFFLCSKKSRADGHRH